jgi:hypothetical protein
MLNELYTLHRSLEHFKVDVEESHPWVKRLGRGDLLIAGIDAAGLITQVEHMGKDEAVTLFKIQQSFHANFPQLNWSAPLWELDSESQQFQQWQACAAEKTAQRAALLRDACANAKLGSVQARIVANLRKFCHELHPRFPRADHSEFAGFPVLIERILDGNLSAETWLRSLSSAMLASAEAALVPLVSVEVLLAGDLTKKDSKSKVAILFDLADCTKFRCRVASPRMGAYLSRRLSETEAGGTDHARCALSGSEMPLETDKLPNPLLPVVGPSYLMAMNKDTPCQTRYGHIGMSIFPVGKNTATALDKALKHLTTAERQGRNWKAVPGNTPKKSNLLLVYLESAPDPEAPIAEMFAGGDESGAVYEALCERVCDALRGRSATANDLLHLFVLNKIDPGRVQVELSEAFTAAQVIQGGQEWQRGAKDRPSLPLKDDFIPSPAEVMRCLQMQWNAAARLTPTPRAAGWRMFTTS